MSEQTLPLLDPSKLNPPVDTRLVTDMGGVQEMVEYLRPLDVIGYDTETNVTEVFTERKLRTIQLGDRNRQYIIDLLAFAGTEEAMLEQGGMVAPVWAQSLTNALRPFLDSKTYLKTGQNVSFEHETVLWNLGIHGWHYYDTMLAEKILHCGEWQLFGKDIWGLKDIVARYYKRALDKKEQIGFDLKTPLTQAQVQYAGLDVRIPIQVRELQMHYAEKDGLTRATQIENDAIPAFVEMKLNGLPVDVAEWLEIVEANEEKHRQNVAALDPFFIPLYGTKVNPSGQMSEEALLEIEMRWRGEEADKELRKQYRKEYQAAARKYKERVEDCDKWEGEAALNYGSDKVMLEALRKMGYKIAATNEKILAKIKDEPVVVALLNYRETSKALSTYGRIYLNFVNPVTGRVHSNFNQLGADTGRTSSVRPNVQQLPKENRRTVKARPGYVLITSDMSGAELRIMAELSGAELWIEMFRQGWDVHSVLAEMIHGDVWLQAAESNCEYYKSKQKCKCKKHEIMRDAIKAINFGIAYGMSEYSLAPRLGITIAQAKSLLSKWKQINDVLADYLHHLTKEVKDTMCSRTMSGFRRKYKLPEWEWAKGIAIERMKADYGHDNVETKDVTKVLGGAWGSIEREATNTPVQGCVLGTTRVFDKASGYVEIQSLAGKAVEVWDGTGYATASVIESGEKQLVKVTLHGGHYIECSPDHKFFVRGTDGTPFWRRAVEIHPQDRVMLSEQLPSWELGVQVRFPFDGSKRNPVGLGSFTGSLYELGVWLGRLASEGTVSAGAVSQFVAEHEKGILPEIERLSALFGAPVRTEDSKANDSTRHPLYKVTVCGRSLSDELNEAGIKSQIPEIAWRSSSLLSGYLKGLFDGDGTVSTDGPSLTFGKGSQHVGWARQVQQALVLFGIRSRVRSYDGDRTVVQVMKSECSKFAERIGFLNEAKQNKLLAIVALKPAWRHGAGFRVKSLVVTDELVPMYDVIDSSTGRFMANGIVVHNSNAAIAKLCMGCGFDKNGKPFLYHTLKQFGAFLLNMVHDELVVECPAECAQECAEAIKDCIRRAGAEFMTQVVMEAEANISQRWEKK